MRSAPGATAHRREGGTIPGVTSEEPGSELGLRDYLRIMGRRRALITVVVLIVTVPAVVLSLLQTPVYEGDAEILLQPRSSETLFDPNSGVRADPARQVQNEIRILTSAPVRTAVRAQIGSAPKVKA